MTSLNSGSFSVYQDPLTGTERAQLKALADAGQFYRLKAIVTNHDGERSIFLTSSKAVNCHFI